jgi:hypothetical protein
MNRHPSRIEKPLRWLSAVLLLAALTALVVLLGLDASNRLHETSGHQRAGALAFILIGSSYISLQLSAGRRWGGKIKHLLLGLGFMLWGLEQFFPPGMWVTVMDSVVVLIFVTDLTLIILKHLKYKEPDAP